MEEAAKVYLEAKDKNDTRTLDKLKNRFDGFQKIEDFITKKNQEQENAASLAAIQDWCIFRHLSDYPRGLNVRTNANSPLNQMGTRTRALQSNVQIAKAGSRKMEDAIECIADHVRNIFAGSVVQKILHTNILDKNATYGLVRINP